MSKPISLNTKRMIVRGCILLLVIAGLFYGLNTLVNKGPDIDFNPNFASQGMVVARMDKDESSSIVIVKPDGTLMEVPGATDSSHDEWPVWTPDGNRILFISDRDKGEPSIFRWKPEKGEVERRSTDRRSKSDLSFQDVNQATKQPMFVVGGYVAQLDYTKQKMKMVLPPGGGELSATGTGEQGAVSILDQVYGNIGTSFRKARWGPNGDFVVAIMRRDGGEVLLMENTSGTTQVNPETGQPMPNRPIILAAAERLDFDVDPKTGNIAFSITGMQPASRDDIPEEFKKNGVFTPPFHNALLIFDWATKGQILVASTDKDITFFSPRYNPDGSAIYVGVGDMKEGYEVPIQLTLMPAKENGAAEAKTIAKGEIAEFDISKDGSKLVYTKKADGVIALFTCDKDGSNEKNLTGKKGNFGSPRFSPKQ